MTQNELRNRVYRVWDNGGPSRLNMAYWVRGARHFGHYTLPE
jgi:hypothetical protein